MSEKRSRYIQMMEVVCKNRKWVYDNGCWRYGSYGDKTYSLVEAYEKELKRDKKSY